MFVCLCVQRECVSESKCERTETVVVERLYSLCMKTFARFGNSFAFGDADAHTSIAECTWRALKGD